MRPRQTLPISSLLIIISILAVAGGLATAILTSPQSFEPVRLALLQTIVVPENTPTITATPSLTPAPATPTDKPTATSSRQAVIYLPTASDMPAGLPKGTSRPVATATATATSVVLPADVWAMATVTTRVGSQFVRIHDMPNGPVTIVAVPGGTVVQVLFGSSVVDGIAWLPVRLPSGRLGWVAGYLLTITVVRPDGTGTVEPLSTPTASPMPAPPTAQGGSTSHPPSNTEAPTATQQPSGPTATPSRAATVFNPPTQTQTSLPAVGTNTPMPLVASATPVTPPATNTPENTATAATTATQAPSDTPLPSAVPPSDTPLPSAVPPSDTPLPANTSAPDTPTSASSP